MDLHKAQIQGFFDIPVDHLFAAPVIIDYLSRQDLQHLTIVAPDAGGAERARAYAKRLGAELAVIDKRRSEDGTAEVMNVIGDIRGRTCVIADDIIDTAGTIQKAAQALKESGAERVLACAVHGVLSGPAIERIEKSPIDKLIVTNTIPLEEKRAQVRQDRRALGGAPARPGHSQHSRRDIGLVTVRVDDEPGAQRPAARRLANAEGKDTKSWKRHSRQSIGRGRARTRRGGCARRATCPRWSTARRRPAMRSRRCRSPSVPKEMMRILHSASGVNTLITLNGPGESTQRVLVREFQLDPVTQALLHADFYRVNLEKKIAVMVPVVLHGEPKGVKTQGGILEFLHKEVEVECLPTAIPEHIDVDVTELELGQAIYVRDLAGQRLVDAAERRRPDARPHRAT